MKSGWHARLPAWGPLFHEKWLQERTLAGYVETTLLVAWYSWVLCFLYGICCFVPQLTWTYTWGLTTGLIHICSAAWHYKSGSCFETGSQSQSLEIQLSHRHHLPQENFSGSLHRRSKLAATIDRTPSVLTRSRRRGFWSCWDPMSRICQQRHGLQDKFGQVS